VRTVTYNLQQFLTEARRNAFVIPRFQRLFVWNQAQVKLLIDSIARNYPIGSLLLLQETKPNDPFLASRQIDAVIRDAEAEEEFDGEDAGVSEFPPAVYYVLDGQQRITSLVRVFLQSPSNSEFFYFDLKQLLDFDTAGRTSPNWVLRRKSTSKLPARCLRSEVVSDPERCQVLVEEYFESGEETLRGDRPAQRRASAKVNRVFETMRNYQIPLVIIDRGDSTEAICRIFETINSTGTRLTTFDLAVARFFPEPDLHQLWHDSRSEYPVLARFSAEGERVLQVIALLVGYETKTYLEATRGTLLSLQRDKIAGRWGEAVQALAQAYDWVEARGAVPNMLANDALLVPLAFFLSTITVTWKQHNPGYGAILERWYFASALQQGARQASNYRVAQSAASLRAWLTDGVTPEAPNVEITPEDLLKLAKSDNRYRAIHSVLRWKGGRDLWTEEPLDPDDIEDHHLFPAVLIKREGLPKRQLDSIANKLLVSTSTNRMLGDRLPSDYFDKLLREAQRSGTLRAKLEMLSEACIPVRGSVEETEALFNHSRTSDFHLARARLIIDKLRTILGDALRSEASGIEIDDQDNEFE
jgi:hypothetical protein